MSTCMCVASDGESPAAWRPCPKGLCERRSHFLHRLRESGRDYRYGGFRAWLRYVASGIPADAEDDL